MRKLETDLSILRKFDFEHAPVGVKFLFDRPEGIEKLDTPAAFCDMIRLAQEKRVPFYFSKSEEDCFGRIVLGMEEAPLFAEAGLLGEKFGVYEEPRANERIYQHIPKLGKGTVNYAAYSVLEALTFEPDLLIIMATPSQAEIVLRAISYSTGELWESKKTPVLSCAWIYAYPWLSGKVNHMITGMGFGSKARHAMPEGWVLISIPWDKIPQMIRSLEKMTWDLPAYSEGRGKFLQRETRIREEGQAIVDAESGRSAEA
jgi:uncharacterized protein (DUF169 family)